LQAPRTCTADQNEDGVIEIVLSAPEDTAVTQFLHSSTDPEVQAAAAQLADGQVTPWDTVNGGDPNRMARVAGSVASRTRRARFLGRFQMRLRFHLRSFHWAYRGEERAMGHLWRPAFRNYLRSCPRPHHLFLGRSIWRRRRRRRRPVRGPSRWRSCWIGVYTDRGVYRRALGVHRLGHCAGAGR
jgi:hypothetical protein